MPLSFLEPSDVARYQRASALSNLAALLQSPSPFEEIAGRIRHLPHHERSLMADIMQCQHDVSEIIAEVHYIRTLL